MEIVLLPIRLINLLCSLLLVVQFQPFFLSHSALSLYCSRVSVHVRYVPTTRGLVHFTDPLPPQELAEATQRHPTG